MSGLDNLVHSRNLTAVTYCDYDNGGYPCIGSVAEPTTMITDYCLTVELFVLSGVLLRSGWTATPTWARNWAVGFAFLGVSFAFGGSEHGFALPLKCEGREECIESSWVWIVTLLTQTPGLALPVIGAAQLVLSASRSAWITASKVYAALIVLVFSVLAIVGAAATPLDGFLVGFLVVIIFSLPSVLIVLVLLCLPVCCCRSQKPSCAHITTLVGWIVCIISLAWQATGIGFAAHFNHNDIFHTIFIIGLGITGAGLHPQLQASIEPTKIVNNV